MEEYIKSIIMPIIGQPCCRIQMHQDRSMSIGFGRKIPHHKPRERDAFFGEWEIGTFQSAWRIMEGKKILFGSQDLVLDEEGFSAAVESVKFGKIVSVE